jgi:CSLREA domain-containing protein
VNILVRSLRSWRRQHLNAQLVAKPSSRPAPLMMETVEPRILFAAFVVNTAADTIDADPNVTSLREAIIATEAAAGVDDIGFDIPGTGVHTINVTSPLPTITQVVTIDGSTQPGYDPNPDSDIAPTPVIVLNGAGAGAGTNGLTIDSSDPGFASNIVGIGVYGFSGNGFLITGDGNFIMDCVVGTNAAGTAAGPGNGGHGFLLDGANNNFILENVVAFNGGNGMTLINGSTGNDVDLNQYFSNNGMAIDLGNDGPTANDPNDADTGVNTLQNKPELTKAVVSPGGVTVTGSIKTTPDTRPDPKGTLVLLTFYYSPVTNPADAEGQFIARTEEIQTRVDGTFDFSYLIEGATAADYITASATSTVYSDDGLNVTINGSEMSTPIKVDGDTSAARVTQVFVNGTGITGQSSPNGIAFRTLAGIDNTFGYPVPAGANQLKAIPWSNGVNKVALRFDTDVAATLGQGDLVIRGINSATYAVTGFTYDAATKTGVWTLASAITNDKVRLFLDDALLPTLDGDWVAGQAYPSGNGAAGGDFDFRLNVLRGDANQDGAVNALDLGQLKAKLNRTATNPGAGATGYTVFADLNADGQINALDLGIGKARLNSKLPLGEPAATSLLFSTAPLSA